MKKLMFATALAASAAAFAALPHGVGFEDANDYNPNVSSSYFYFDGTSDGSAVTNVSPSTTRTAYFAGLDPVPANENYLQLDTEGGTLWRSLNTINSDTTGEPGSEVTTYGLGEAQTVAATGTYLDTLVQFTVTEDEEPQVGTDDKLAIWLGIDTNGVETTTNLMVKAGLIDDQGGITETTFKLNGSVNSGEWYRLTVKALSDITDTENIPGFQIYLNGELRTSSTPTLTSVYLEILGPDDMNDSHYADIVAGKYFASLSTATTLQGVGFKGTGAVDEIVWTEDDPFPAAPIEFTLTWTAAEVDAVSYVLSTDLTTTNSLTSGTAVQFAPGDGTATIELIPTFSSGYEFDKVTMGESDLGLTFAIPSVTTNATLLAKTTVVEDWVENPTTEITPEATAAAAYPGLAGSALATADAQKLTAWAKANSIAYNDIKNDTTGTYTEAYLLNCAVADVDDEKEEFKANITISADGTPTVTTPDGKKYNGTPQMKGSNDLSTWTDVNAASTDYHFYKYVLSL